MPLEIPERNANYWVGLDVGGANIKIADVNGKSQSLPFPMWTDYQSLSATLSNLIQEFTESQHPNVAATMTGELADCFASKQDGVKYICRALDSVTENKCFVYQVSDPNGKFVSSQDAANDWRPTAASNWHALTNFVARQTESGIVFDIGSTSTDIIPFAGGHCISDSITDTERLAKGELVYTGVVRSPICALLDKVVLCDGSKIQVAHELFANMLDAYLLLDKIPKSESTRFTADGRASTISCASQRLARTLCADVSEIETEDIDRIATAAATAQRQLITESFSKVFGRLLESTTSSTKIQNPKIVVSGEGAWLAKSIADECSRDLPIVHLSDLVSKDDPSLHTAATAYAVAHLAAIHQARSTEVTNANR